MKYTHILWDWNGTLLDDVMISIDCVNVLLKKMNKAETNLDEYYQMMDIPLYKYYENLFKSRNCELKYELCTENFQNNYQNFIGDAHLMSGAIEMLEFFKNNGAKQYIVSSFEKNRLIQYTKYFKVYDYFEQISGDNDINCAPKSERAINLIKDIPRKNILYIGDTEADYITAKDVGCACVLICKGHQPRRLLEKFGCPVINDLTEIKKLI
ncbi:MAG: HAD family hydrolase [Acutalibacteraceae bacterium]